MSPFGTSSSKKSDKAKSSFPDPNPNDPEKGIEALLRIYKLLGVPDCGKNSHSKGPCLSSPYCFGGLDPKKWSRPTNALKIKREIEPGDVALIGIQNTKRTCYMNTMVQVWSRNPLISSLFLNFDVPKGQKAGNVESEHSEGLSMVLLMQKAFARLRFSQYSVIELNELIAKTKLSIGEDQDYHEFSKLMFDKIIEDPSPSLSPFITNLKALMMGEYTEKRVCTKCGSTSPDSRPTLFSDLGLSVPNVSRGLKTPSLEELLKSCTISPETILDYNCSSCGPNRECESTRSITVLPQVLTIHLLRYKWSRKLNKVQTEVIYPDRLDMGPYLDPGAGGIGIPVPIFELTAVVHHEGPDVVAGHFSCEVKINGIWYYCNDKAVLEGALQRRGQLRSETSKPQDTGMHSSKTAYILYYTQVNSLVKYEEIQPSTSRHQMAIAQEEDQLESRTQAIQKFWQSTTFTKSRPKILSHLSSETNGEFEFVPVDWLMNWMSFGRLGSKSTELNELGVVCEHGKVCPPGLTDQTLKYKVIRTTDANDFFREFFNGGKMESWERKCVAQNLCYDCGKVRALGLSSSQAQPKVKLELKEEPESSWKSWEKELSRVEFLCDDSESEPGQDTSSTFGLPLFTEPLKFDQTPFENILNEGDLESINDDIESWFSDIFVTQDIVDNSQPMRPSPLESVVEKEDGSTIPALFEDMDPQSQPVDSLSLLQDDFLLEPKWSDVLKAKEFLPPQLGIRSQVQPVKKSQLIPKTKTKKDGQKLVSVQPDELPVLELLSPVPELSSSLKLEIPDIPDLSLVKKEARPIGRKKHKGKKFSEIPVKSQSIPRKHGEKSVSVKPDELPVLELLSPVPQLSSTCKLEIPDIPYPNLVEIKEEGIGTKKEKGKKFSGIKTEPPDPDELVLDIKPFRRPKKITKVVATIPSQSLELTQFKAEVKEEHVVKVDWDMDIIKYGTPQKLMPFYADPIREERPIRACRLKREIEPPPPDLTPCHALVKWEGHEINNGLKYNLRKRTHRPDYKVTRTYALRSPKENKCMKLEVFVKKELDLD